MYVCVHVDFSVVFFLPEMVNKVEYIIECKLYSMVSVIFVFGFFATEDSLARDVRLYVACH